MTRHIVAENNATLQTFIDKAYRVALNITSWATKFRTSIVHA